MAAPASAPTPAPIAVLRWVVLIPLFMSAQPASARAALAALAATRVLCRIDLRMGTPSVDDETLALQTRGALFFVGQGRQSPRAAHFFFRLLRSDEILVAGH